MQPDFEFQTPRADSAELQRIKSNFQVGDNERSELFELRDAQRKDPIVLSSGIITTDEKFSEKSLKGLTYPLQLDGKGGLKTSSNFTRLSEQIQETLETRVGERVFRQFFGIPELQFETVSEDILAALIKKQLRDVIPFETELEVDVAIREDGTSTIFVRYELEGAGSFIVKQSIDNNG